MRKFLQLTGTYNTRCTFESILLFLIIYIITEIKLIITNRVHIYDSLHEKKTIHL